MTIPANIRKKHGNQPKEGKDVWIEKLSAEDRQRFVHPFRELENGELASDRIMCEENAKTLKARATATLATYADGYDIPVLVSQGKHHEFRAP